MKGSISTSLPLSVTSSKQFKEYDDDEDYYNPILARQGKKRLNKVIVHETIPVYEPKEVYENRQPEEFALISLYDLDFEDDKRLKNLKRKFDKMQVKEYERLVSEWLNTTSNDKLQQTISENLITILVSVEKHDLLVSYIKMWSAVYSDEATVPIISKIMTYELSNTELDVIMEALDPEFYDIARGIVLMKNNQSICMAIQNMTYLFNRDYFIDIVALDKLRDLSLANKNTWMTDYLVSMIRHRQDTYAPIPSWIIKPKILVTHQELVDSIKIPEFVPQITGNIDNAVGYINMIKYACSTDTDDPEQYTEYLKDKLSRIDPEEIVETLENISRNIFCSEMRHDHNMFRVFGPCHPFPEGYDMELHSKDPCEMYGGCRMYHCYENENEDKYSKDVLYEDPVDNGTLHLITWWKRKLCDNIECNKKIRKRCHAVRIPLPTGGWKGYYCSWNCVRQTTVDTNEILVNLINIYESQCIAIGVYDRLDK